MTVVTGATETAASVVAALNASGLQCGLKQLALACEQQMCKPVDPPDCACNKQQQQQSSTQCQQQQGGKHAIQITACAGRQQFHADPGRAVLMQGFGWDSCRQHHSKYYEHVHSKVPELQVSNAVVIITRLSNAQPCNGTGVCTVCGAIMLKLVQPLKHVLMVNMLPATTDAHAADQAYRGIL